mgnify:FL=1|jgi:hypothetical protein|tara:strand:+ start:205 stop:393 length:189 start_codon:yes stop_codon:yes gene_type:complete
MIIKNLVENKDGSTDFDFKVDKKETEFLLSFAIKALMREGIIKTALEEGIDQEVELPLETMH